MRLRRGLNESGKKRTVCRVVQRQCHETLIMSQFHLQLRVDAPGSDGDRLAHALTEASQRVRASLYRRLGLKVHSNAWVTIALGSDAGRRTVQAILEECRAGNVVAGSATVFERWDEAETAAADWFYVTTKTADRSFSLWDDYPSYAQAPWMSITALCRRCTHPTSSPRCVSRNGACSARATPGPRFHADLYGLRTRPSVQAEGRRNRRRAHGVA